MRNFTKFTPSTLVTSNDWTKYASYQSEVLAHEY